MNDKVSQLKAQLDSHYNTFCKNRPAVSSARDHQLRVEDAKKLVAALRDLRKNSA
jgi:hypothetical protein